MKKEENTADELQVQKYLYFYFVSENYGLLGLHNQGFFRAGQMAQIFSDGSSWTDLALPIGCRSPCTHHVFFARIFPRKRVLTVWLLSPCHITGQISITQLVMRENFSWRKVLAVCPVIHYRDLFSKLGRKTCSESCNPTTPTETPVVHLDVEDVVLYGKARPVRPKLVQFGQ